MEKIGGPERHLESDFVGPVPFRGELEHRLAVLRKYGVFARRYEIQELPALEGRPSDLRSEGWVLNYPISRPPPSKSAPEMRPPETPWYTPVLKRSENAARAMTSKSPPLSHLRAHPSSTTPYRVLSCNDRATATLPADP